MPGQRHLASAREPVALQQAKAFALAFDGNQQALALPAGHSRPRLSAPVRINVRYDPIATRMLRRGE